MIHHQMLTINPQIIEAPVPVSSTPRRR